MNQNQPQVPPTVPPTRPFVRPRQTVLSRAGFSMPSQEILDQFRHETGTNFDPNSIRDIRYLQTLPPLKPTHAPYVPGAVAAAGNAATLARNTQFTPEVTPPAFQPEVSQPPTPVAPPAFHPQTSPEADTMFQMQNVQMPAHQGNMAVSGRTLRSSQAGPAVFNPNATGRYRPGQYSAQ